MRILILILLTLSISYGANSLKVATYNVENIFDLHFNGNEYKEYIPNSSWQWNQKNYRKKLKNIAKVIVDINADVIALQEIESWRALKDLQSEINRQGLYYQYLRIASQKKTTVKVAVLSKYPLKAAQEVYVTSSRRYRNILEVTLKYKHQDLTLFINHWKSKSGPESRRIVSAKALKKRLQQLHNKNYVLLGDFNSHYEEYKTFVKKRKHNDTLGQTGINHVLQTVQYNNPIHYKDLKTCDDCSYNLWYELKEKDRWSHIYRGKKEALDSIIISPALADNQGLEYKKGSFHSFVKPYLFHVKKGKKQLYRWQISYKYPKHHKGKGYSDHLALVAEFIVVP